MTVKDIINQVRWCIDEESGSTDFVDTYMDNIIKAKINDALRWVCLYADASLLGGSGSSSSSSADNPTIRSYTYTNGVSSTSDAPTYTNGVFTLPFDYLRLIRLRVSSWNKGVSVPVDEDSYEYDMESNGTAKSDADCPKVGFINDYPNQLELYPKPKDSDTIHLVIAISPSEVTITDGQEASTTVAVPPKVKSAFIYYLAYLVLCAYNDANKAALMLGVAKAHIGGASSQTDAG